MSGLFESIIRGLVGLFCGSEPTKPDAGQPPSPKPHRPQAQQQVPSPYTRPEDTYTPARPSPQYPSSPKPHRPPYSDPNQVNQHNEHYMSLRARANDQGDEMAKSFEESHQAYARGDGALAKELSNKGKAHQREMERLNKEASEWIYVENNKDSEPGEIDLHGLYVKEALTYTERAIQEARRRGDSQIHLIVGKGLHSRGGVAKIKPAIEELVQKHQLVAEVDPQNAGVVIVSLDGRQKGTGQVVRPEDIARGLEGRNEGCVIM